MRKQRDLKANLSLTKTLKGEPRTEKETQSESNGAKDPKGS